MSRVCGTTTTTTTTASLCRLTCCRGTRVRGPKQTILITHIHTPCKDDKVHDRRFVVGVTQWEVENAAAWEVSITYPLSETIITGNPFYSNDDHNLSESK